MSISTTVLIAFAALVVSLNAEPRPRPQWPGLDNWGGSNPWGNGGWGNGGWGNGGCGNSRGWDRNGYGRPGLPGIPSLPAIPTRRNSGCGWSQGPRGCGCSSCGGYPFGGNRFARDDHFGYDRFGFDRYGPGYDRYQRYASYPTSSCCSDNAPLYFQNGNSNIDSPYATSATGYTDKGRYCGTNFANAEIRDGLF